MIYENLLAKINNSVGDDRLAVLENKESNALEGFLSKKAPGNKTSVIDFLKKSQLRIGAVYSGKQPGKI